MPALGKTTLIGPVEGEFACLRRSSEAFGQQGIHLRKRQSALDSWKPLAMVVSGRTSGKCRMTLGNIARAFLHCADRYSTCPIYQQLWSHERKRLHRRAAAAARFVAAS